MLGALRGQQLSLLKQQAAACRCLIHMYNRRAKYSEHLLGQAMITTVGRQDWVT